jgi:two-component system, chemotaxis family, protein-glutamate methylesterase/glutaminase
MPGHDIIVIGSSAGGIDALIRLAAALPADLPAALFVVQHIAAEGTSLLPEILSNAGPLPAQHPTDGATIERGCIYVAPPDHHMLVENRHIHVMRGQKENSFRPAIDATFRTAAGGEGPPDVGVLINR